MLLINKQTFIKDTNTVKPLGVGVSTQNWAMLPLVQQTSDVMFVRL